MPIVPQEQAKLKDIFGDTFEQHVLCALCQSEDFLLQYAHVLKATYFSSITIRNIVTCIISYYQLYGKSPTKDEVEISINELFWQSEQKELKLAQKDLLERGFSTKINLDFIRANLQKFMVKAEMGSLLYDAVNKFDSLEPEELQKSIERISEIQSTGDFGVSLEDFATKILSQNDDQLKYQTSFPSVDRMLRGGIKAGELLVIMAPTNRGKSQTIINFAKGFLLSGANVLHVTIGDMYEDGVVERYLACMAQLTLGELEEAKYVKEIFQKIEEVRIVTSKGLKAKYFAGGTLSVFELEGFIKQLSAIKKFDTEVLVIDYADLMKPTNPKLEKRHQLSEIYVGLRALGKKLNIPIITASQTNRAGERVDFKTDREVTGSFVNKLSPAHMAEDYGKAANADYIVSLRRPTPYSKIFSDEQVMVIDVIKSRNSPVGVEIPMRINFNKCYMEEYPSLDMVDYLGELREADRPKARQNVEGIL